MFLTYSSLASCTRIMGHTTKCENISKLQTLLHSGLLPGQNWAEQIQINSRKLPECVSIHSSLWGARETIFHTENIQRYTSIWHPAAAKQTNVMWHWDLSTIGGCLLEIWLFSFQFLTVDHILHDTDLSAHLCSLYLHLFLLFICLSCCKQI